MPHLKCTACKIRVHSPHSLVGGVGELCPGCESLLERAVSLDELVGFRVVSLSAGAGQWDIAVSAALQAPDSR